jgi:photosystem II reaction center protein PsbM
LAATQQEAQFEGHALEEPVAKQAEGGSWIESWYVGFSMGMLATFSSISAAVLAARSRIQRQSLFSTQELHAAGSSTSPSGQVYSVSSPDSFRGRLVARFDAGFMALAEGMAVSSAAYIATLAGLFIPVVFLVTLYIQSEARKAAESGSEGDKF